MKRVNCYIYTRVSTAMQVDGYSLDAQREKLRRYAEFQNMQIAGEYTDEGKSGKKQVVIPESIRIGCGFGEGTTFTVVAKGNAVMLQAIVAPPRDLFNELARESRAAAKAAGMRPSDISAAIREVHAERRAARAKGIA